MTELRDSHLAEVEDGDPTSAVLRAPLGRVDARRESIAKEWLIGAIREAPLSEAGTLPIKWAAEELPELLTEVLVAVVEGEEAVLGRGASERARGLGKLRSGLTPAKLAADLARMQGEVTRLVLAEIEGESPDLKGRATARIARAFGRVSGEAQEALMGSLGTEEAFVAGLKRPEGLRRRVRHLVEAHRRHDQPFAVTLFDVDGPGAEHVDLVAEELRRSIRVLDETYRLEENELCVLAPFQSSADGVRMAERLANRLAELERHEQWRITISAGVAACPENGDEPDSLLEAADTAMWRARATGRPVAVAGQRPR